jgi:hypothetical protein
VEGASAGGGTGHVAPPMEFGPHCGGKEAEAYTRPLFGSTSALSVGLGAAFRGYSGGIYGASGGMSSRGCSGSVLC